MTLTRTVPAPEDDEDPVEFYANGPVVDKVQTRRAARRLFKNCRFRNQFRDAGLELAYRARFMRQSCKQLPVTFFVSGAVQLLTALICQFVLPLKMTDFAVTSSFCGAAHLLIGMLQLQFAHAHSQGTCFAGYWGMQIFAGTAALAAGFAAMIPLIRHECALSFLTAGYAWYASVAMFSQYSWRLGSEVLVVFHVLWYAVYYYTGSQVSLESVGSTARNSLLILCGLLMLPVQVGGSIMLERVHRKRFASHQTLTADLQLAEKLLKKQRDNDVRTRVNTLLACAHDLKTPVIAANHCMCELKRSTSQLVTLKDCPHSLRDDSALEVRNLEACIASALDTIENITTAVGAGEPSLVPVPCKPRELLQRAVIACGITGTTGAGTVRRFSTCNINVHVDQSVPEELVLAKHAVMRIVTNLVSNAVKFTPRGGPISVVACLRKHSNQCSVPCQFKCTVHDTGCGVPNEAKDKIFDLHRRLHDKRVPGLGVGLSSVLKLVRMLGGDCGVDDNREAPDGRIVGSSFWFWVPIRTCPTAPQATATAAMALPKSSQALAPGALSILLVEDQHIVREILTHRLQQAGCRVTAANNSEDALRILRSTRFSCVFCDMHMPPGDDGITVVAQLRDFERASSLPPQPVYLLTANVMDSSLEERASGLVLGIIDKQVPVEEMVSLARAAAMPMMSSADKTNASGPQVAAGDSSSDKSGSRPSTPSCT